MVFTLINVNITFFIFELPHHTLPLTFYPFILLFLMHLLIAHTYRHKKCHFAASDSGWTRLVSFKRHTKTAILFWTFCIKNKVYEVLKAEITLKVWLSRLSPVGIKCHWLYPLPLWCHNVLSESKTSWLAVWFVINHWSWCDVDDIDKWCSLLKKLLKKQTKWQFEMEVIFVFLFFSLRL